MMDKINPKFRVSLFVMEGEDPLICAVSGPATIAILQDLESQIHSQMPSRELKEDGTYDLTVSRFEGQYGEYGRCELEPYWEWDVERFEPIYCEEDS